MHFAIIAAGDGSRLSEEGVACPKPLVDLDGRPMIRRLIDIFVGCGAESVSVIVNERMTEVRDYLEGIADRMPCMFNMVVKSTPSSMHSFHEVSCILPAGDKFVLTTVDTIFRADEFAEYVRRFESDDESDGLMAVTSFVDDEKPLYVAADPVTMKIRGFYDEKRNDTAYVSGGIYGLRAAALRVLQACIDNGVGRMRNYQRALVDSGLSLKACPFSKIIDVDHVSDILTARTFINA